MNTKFVGSSQKKFKCEICQNFLSTKYSLNSHKRSVHETAMSFQCNICKKEFYQIGDINKHIKTVKKNNNKAVDVKK
jgi:uncharacterized Zn-finger protein